jgi:O-antigen/teichoic acid export membrane protein
MSIHSRLFQEGAEGHHGSLRLTMRMLPLVFAYGVLAWLGFALAAPLIAALFGPGYEPLARILPILGVLPLLRAVADFGAEIFITSDRPGVQALVQSGSTALRIVVGLFLIMQFGLDGAVANTVAVTGLTAVVLWALALRGKAPERQA